jgi:hypothetical protein
MQNVPSQTLLNTIQRKSQHYRLVAVAYSHRPPFQTSICFIYYIVLLDVLSECVTQWFMVWFWWFSVPQIALTHIYIVISLHILNICFTVRKVLFKLSFMSSDVWFFSVKNHTSAQVSISRTRTHACCYTPGYNNIYIYIYIYIYTDTHTFIHTHTYVNYNEKCSFVHIWAHIPVSLSQHLSDVNQSSFLFLFHYTPTQLLVFSSFWTWD